MGHSCATHQVLGRTEKDGGFMSTFKTMTVARVQICSRMSLPSVNDEGEWGIISLHDIWTERTNYPELVTRPKQYKERFLRCLCLPTSNLCLTGMMLGTEGVISKACNINKKCKFRRATQLGYDMEQCVLFLLYCENLDTYWGHKLDDLSSPWNSLHLLNEISQLCLLRSQHA